MELLLTPEIGVPLAPRENYLDLRERAMAACNTAQDLAKFGLDIEPTDADKQAATALALSYAEDPEKTSKQVTEKKAATLRAPSLILANNILCEFGHAVVENAVHIRHLVTNKLILETENPDPRVRLRALELLGKVSDVGLFAEKTEVTVTHKTTNELREQLRSKLTRLISKEEEEDATYAEFEEVSFAGEAIDVDAELGLK